MKEVQSWAAAILDSVEQVIFGKRTVAEQLLVAILCRGHVLVEDVPGVGKTLIARAFSRALGGDFKQIQCTPDLLPSDVLGVSVFNTKEEEFVFKHGPVFANFLLVDEINRATPRTQSALLEAMAESQVSIEGATIPLPNPFFMIATQSPAESEGTFPLPEVQKDRFFLSLQIGYPNRASEEKLIISQRQGAAQLESLPAVTDTEALLAMQEKILSVHAEESIKDYILRIIMETRHDNRLDLGVSPRGSLALFRGAQAVAAIHARDYVVPEDVKSIANSVLVKRILIKSGYSARGLTPQEVIDTILHSVEVPGYRSE